MAIRRLSVALGVAGALHLALLAAIAVRGERPSSTTLQGPESQEVTVELAWLGEEKPPSAPQGSAGPSRGSRAAGPERAAVARSKPLRAAPHAEPAAQSPVGDAAPAASPPAEATGGDEPATAPGVFAPAAAVASAKPAGLSLSQLGLEGASPLVRFPTDEATPRAGASGGAAARERAENAVEKSLAQGLLDHDRALGNGGAHAPVAEALRVAAFRLAPNYGKARLVAVADASGRVTSLTVESVDRDFALWEKLARQALAALASQRLRTGVGRPVELVFDVESAVLLPSGRAPGMGVSLLGIPLKKKEHARSGEVALLDPVPEVTLDEVPDPRGGGGTIWVPRVSVKIFGVPLDPVDLGAGTQKVVHARLVRQTVL